MEPVKPEPDWLVSLPVFALPSPLAQGERVNKTKQWLSSVQWIQRVYHFSGEVVWVDAAPLWQSGRQLSASILRKLNASSGSFSNSISSTSSSRACCALVFSWWSVSLHVYKMCKCGGPVRKGECMRARMCMCICGPSKHMGKAPTGQTSLLKWRWCSTFNFELQQKVGLETHNTTT